MRVAIFAVGLTLAGAMLSGPTRAETIAREAEWGCQSEKVAQELRRLWNSGDKEAATSFVEAKARRQECHFFSKGDKVFIDVKSVKLLRGAVDVCQRPAGRPECY